VVIDPDVADIATRQPLSPLAGQQRVKALSRREATKQNVGQAAARAEHPLGHAASSNAAPVDTNAEADLLYGLVEQLLERLAHVHDELLLA